MTIQEQIMATLATDGNQAFDLLIDNYQQQVYWHIRRMVVAHDDAQDATQETFIRVFRSLAQLSEVRSIKAWILKIATNEALRIIERRKTQEVSLDDDEHNAFQAYADSYVDYTREAEVKLQQAILSLPLKQQQAFSLRYYDELSYDEIAEVTSSSAIGAKMNYHIAKNKIVNYFKTNN